MNPWLQVPLSEYEGHMASPAVQQLDVLAAIFAEVLALRVPESVAVVGVAGGNGLDRIDSSTPHRIVGVDINPEYLAAARERYAGLSGLELHCADLASERIAIDPVDLVHVALVFEHAGMELCFENAISLVAPGGALSVVLQLPTQADANVGTSNFAAVQRFKDHFQLVEPEAFTRKMSEHGFQLIFKKRYPLVSGKAFWTAVFSRES